MSGAFNACRRHGAVPREGCEGCSKTKMHNEIATLRARLAAAERVVGAAEAVVDHVWPEQEEFYTHTKEWKMVCDLRSALAAWKGEG